MTGREFRENLHGDSVMLGTLIVSTSPFWPKLVAGSGLDFVFIDTEHIAIDREHLSWMCRTYGAMGLPPLVRISEPNPYLATMAYDDGATAVVAPYIEEVEQVSWLCGAGKKRPLKGKRLTDALEGNSLEPDLDAYIKKGTTENSVVINVESRPA
ncbi:MAG: aldolase, partial [Verrucomicrobiota bacterium]